jgi:hypothetical protein
MGIVIGNGRETSRDWGIVTALPTGAKSGDVCTYKAAAGVYWRLTYTAESAEFPWNKIGGAPLIAVSNVARKLVGETYTSLPTDPLSITVPLKGDYDMTIQAECYNLVAGRQPLLSYAIGATVASDNWCCDFYGNGAAGAASATCTTRQTGVAVSAKVEEKAKSIGGETQFNRRRLIIDPVRVG